MYLIHRVCTQAFNSGCKCIKQIHYTHTQCTKNCIIAALLLLCAFHRHENFYKNFPSHICWQNFYSILLKLSLLLIVLITKTVYCQTKFSITKLKKVCKSTWFLKNLRCHTVNCSAQQMENWLHTMLPGIEEKKYLIMM